MHIWGVAVIYGTIDNIAYCTQRDKIQQDACISWDQWDKIQWDVFNSQEVYVKLQEQLNFIRAR